jgi:hypothetical protein
MKKYTKSINVKLSPNEFETLQQIRKVNKISISKMLRDNIPFLQAFYQGEI